MMYHKRCVNCKSRFYADEDDMFDGKYYCSYCYEKLFKCLICEEIKVMKKSFKIDRIICKDCREEFGAFPNAWLILRFKTFRKDNFTCRYCGRSPLKDLNIKLSCDHIIPRSAGGGDEFSNLVTSCSECNSGKLDFVLEKYQENMIKAREVFKNGSLGNNIRIEKKGENKMENIAGIKCKLANCPYVGKENL